MTDHDYTITVVHNEKCPACNRPGLVTAEAVSAMRTTCALCGWAHLSSHAGQQATSFVSVEQSEATSWVQTEEALRASFAYILGVRHVGYLAHLGGMAETAVDALRKTILRLEGDLLAARAQVQALRQPSPDDNGSPDPAPVPIPEEWFHVNTFEDGFQLQMHDWCGWCSYHHIGLKGRTTDTVTADGKRIRVTYIYMTKKNADALLLMQTSNPARFGIPWNTRKWAEGYGPSAAMRTLPVWESA